MALRKDLSEKEVNWERGRRSTYGYSKKLDTTIVRLMRMINEERGLPDPFRKTPFVFTGVFVFFQCLRSAKRRSNSLRAVSHVFKKKYWRLKPCREKYL